LSRRFQHASRPDTAGRTHGRACCSKMGTHMDFEAGVPLDLAGPAGTGSREDGRPCGFLMRRELQNHTSKALAAGDHRGCVEIKEPQGRTGRCGPRTVSRRGGWPSGRLRGGGGGWPAASMLLARRFAGASRRDWVGSLRNWGKTKVGDDLVR
jgi:hypothetical protein